LSTGFIGSQCTLYNSIQYTSLLSSLLAESLLARAQDLLLTQLFSEDWTAQLSQQPSTASLVASEVSHSVHVTVYFKSRIFAIYIVSEINIEVRVGTFLPTPTPAAPKLFLAPTPTPRHQLHSPEGDPQVCKMLLESEMVMKMLPLNCVDLTGTDTKCLHDMVLN
jgi:hypothetical protein